MVKPDSKGFSGNALASSFFGGVFFCPDPMGRAYFFVKRNTCMQG